MRSSQPMERANRTTNEIMLRICVKRERRGEDWLALSRQLEKKAVDRLYRIQTNGKWKTKHKDQISRDKAYQTAFDRYNSKQKQIDQDEYLRRLVKMNKDNRNNDLSKDRNAIMKPGYNSDTDSESE